jgi:hypothetical protein
MDASNPGATTPEGFLGGTAARRTDLYTGRGTLAGRATGSRESDTPSRGSTSHLLSRT